MCILKNFAVHRPPMMFLLKVTKDLFFSFYLSVHIKSRDKNATSVADIRPEDRDDYAAGIISNPKEKI